MNDGTKQVLEVEAARGDRYKGAWNDLVEPFFLRKSEELYDSFVNTPSHDLDGLVAVRMQHNALTALKVEFASFIETGKLAQTTLDKENENGK